MRGFKDQGMIHIPLWRIMVGQLSTRWQPSTYQGQSLGGCNFRSVYFPCELISSIILTFPFEYLSGCLSGSWYTGMIIYLIPIAHPPSLWECLFEHCCIPWILFFWQTVFPINSDVHTQVCYKIICSVDITYPWGLCGFQFNWPSTSWIHHSSPPAPCCMIFYFFWNPFPW